MDGLRQDMRFGFRALIKSPAFSAVSILVLALGIGGNTAIFSVVNAVLLRALPYKNANRLVVVWEHNRTSTTKHNVVAPGDFLDWRDRAESFDEMAAFYDTPFNLTGTGTPVEVAAQVSTGNLFELLGAYAEIGRTYSVEDEQPGHDDVVVLSHELWQRQFGGADDIVGKSLTLNGHLLTVLGVMPPAFKWFVKENSFVGKPPQIWTPAAFTNRTRGNRYLSVVARLKPGVSAGAAQTEMETIAASLERQYPDSNTHWGATLVPVREQLSGEIKTALLVLLGAVGFVLLIACANVANLTMARAVSRQKEIAIRQALGAGRWRVARQLLTESVVLSLAGGVAGLILAMFAVDVLVALTPENLINAGEVGLSLPVLVFTFGISLLTGIIFGVWPAVEAARSDPQDALNETGRANTGSSRSRRVRQCLVIAEVALALVLLVGASLMMQSFLRLESINPGFDAKSLLTMRVLLPRLRYPDDASKIAFFRQAVQRVQALPGVRSASAVSAPPFAGLGAATGFSIVGQPAPASSDAMVTDVRAVDENYFRTMNIPIISGRTFTPEEGTENRRVVIVNQMLARTYLAGKDPIGQRLLIDMNARPEPTEIIGVVGDANYDTLDGDVRAMVYWPHPQLVVSAMTIIARTERNPASLGSAAEHEIQALDKDQPVADVRSMESWIAESIARIRFGTLLLNAFAAIALMLAIVGIYGVVSYSVTQRTHEIGIRIALGAHPTVILRSIVGQGLSLALIGVALGLGASFGLTRLMTSLLFRVRPTDPATFVIVAFALTGAALLACYLPARKATTVDPITALRCE
jgi:putative ABC transport system permease protein